MSAATWFIIAILGFLLAGVAFVVAVFMFIKMNIPAVIGDLSGKTVAREIKAMREANAAGAEKRFRPGNTNVGIGTLTKKAQVSPNVQKKVQAYEDRKSEVKGLVDATGSSPTEPLKTQTDILSNDATEVLSNNVTEVLTEETTILSDRTEVLNPTEKLEETVNEPVVFKVTKSEVIIHSDEVI